MSELVVEPFPLDPCIREQIESMEIPLHPPIWVFGRECQPRRYTLFFSDDSDGYTFSGQKIPAEPLTSALKALLDQVNEKTNDEFNGILLNVYKSGTDCIGAHSDDERELGNSGVAMITWGQPRKFRVRSKRQKGPYSETDLPIDSRTPTFAWMKGTFQQDYTHEIPVETKRNGTRYSLTFRRHMTLA